MTFMVQYSNRVSLHENTDITNQYCKSLMFFRITNPNPLDQ